MDGDGSGSTTHHGWMSKTTHEVAVDTFSEKVIFFGLLDLSLWEGGLVFGRAEATGMFFDVTHSVQPSVSFVGTFLPVWSCLIINPG